MSNSHLYNITKVTVGRGQVVGFWLGQAKLELCIPPYMTVDNVTAIDKNNGSYQYLDNFLYG